MPPVNCGSMTSEFQPPYVPLHELDASLKTTGFALLSAASVAQWLPASVAELPAFYDPQARFKDPFKDVQGLAAIGHIFEHMFVSLEAPRFVIKDQIVQGQQCFLTWEFRFKFKNFNTATESATTAVKSATKKR